MCFYLCCPSLKSNLCKNYSIADAQTGVELEYSFSTINTLIWQLVYYNYFESQILTLKTLAYAVSVIVYFG